tara:strand:- start:2638 stop:2742 length:105 start_codon:yes stop_codon:yes gene_type:complete
MIVIISGINGPVRRLKGRRYTSKDEKFIILIFIQ